MRAKQLSDLLKKGDRVAVSNITGREASQVTEVSQEYCANIIGGWALGKGGQTIKTPQGSIHVYATFEELLRLTPKEKHPNKILIYSPPDAVYGEVKEILKKNGETYTKKELLLLTELANHVFREFELKTLGKTVEEIIDNG